MHYLLRISLISFLSTIFLNPQICHAKHKDLQNLSNRIEIALNKRDEKIFNSLFSKKVSTEIKSQYYKFLKQIPNAKWEISPSKGTKDKLKVIITGHHNIGNHKYDLNAEQIISIKQSNQKIIEYKILNEFSILNETGNDLEITMRIPDSVLTGTKYNVDIILEKPLNKEIIAGGLVSLSERELLNKASNHIDLYPLSSGGIYKIVQAPLRQGYQRLAALIAHPDGLITITKKVNIVSD